MDRKRVSGSTGSDNCRRHRKATPGLRIIARDGFWHIHGTIRVGGRSVRIRRGTGLPATAENLEAAEALRLNKERDVRDEVAFGVKPTVALAVAAHQYLNHPRPRPLGDTTVDHITEVSARFGKRLLSGITEFEWAKFVEERQAGNATSTRERYLNSLLGFLSWCRKKPRQYLTALPTFERAPQARQQRSRKRRRVAELTPEILLLWLEEAPKHYRGQLVVMMVTGWRVSSIALGVRLCDLILAVDRQGQNRSSITTHRTKNGEPVTAALPTAAVPYLKAYLKWRGGLHEREEALFLTDTREPYAEGGKYGRRAFQSARAGVVARLRRLAASEARARRQALSAWPAEERRAAAREAIAERLAQAELVAQVTPHWFRHRFATKALADGIDLRTTMEQAGWLDYRSVMGYAHDVPPQRREAIERLDVLPAGGNGLTPDAKVGRKND
jgi:site-specific recombinase XerD